MTTTKINEKEVTNVVEFEACDLPVSTVTVYPDRAEVKRLVKCQLNEGKNEILVKNVSPEIDGDSVRVDGRGSGATICEVQYMEKAVKRGDADREQIKQLEKDKECLVKKRAEMEDRVKLLMRQGEVLDGVARQVGNNGSNSDNRVLSDNSHKPTSLITTLTEDTLRNLENFLNFYEKNQTEVQEKLRDLTREKVSVIEEIDVLQRRINDLGGGDEGFFGDYSRQVSVLVESEHGGLVELDISYQVYQASWEPSYDIRVFTNSDSTDEKTENKMKIHYYGLVKQLTGEDWLNARLFLSTATPSIGGVVPELDTQNVKFYRPIIPRDSSRGKMPKIMSLKKRSLNEMAESAEWGASEENDEICEYAMSRDMPVMNVATARTPNQSNPTSSCFEVSRQSQTIPSDGTEHKVNVALLDLAPILHYETVPCKRAMAFLTASVTNSTPYPFLPGPTAIYFNSSFVAKSHMKSVSPQEQFQCSLGPDPSVRIDYKPGHKYSEHSGYVSKYTTDIYEKLVTVTNSKHGQAIKLKLNEQIPKSTDEKIKVSLEKPELTKHKEPNKDVLLNKDNNLEWTVTIGPTEKRELQIKYRIEYPASEKIEFWP